MFLFNRCQAVSEARASGIGYEEEPGMTCELEKKTDEELLAEVPKAVKGGNYGHFKKQEELLNGRPVYFSASEDNIARKPLYFVYVQKNAWKLENVWMLCEEAENDTYAWKTFCFSPDRAYWPTSSDWKETLYVEARSMKQRHNSPEKPRKELAEDGRYELHLFDLNADQLEKRSTFVIDDYIPCLPGPWYGPPRLAFANGTDKLFAPILEKTFAKYYGSYSNLHGGGSTYAIAMMTGETRGLMFAALHEYDDKNHRCEVIKQGGLAVYEDKNPQSKKIGVLPEGANLEILEIHGQRINFRNTDFPSSGWISSYVAGRRTIKIKGCALFRRRGTVGSTAPGLGGGWFRWHMRENVVSSMGQKIGQMKEVDDPFQMLLDYDARNYLMTAGIVSPEEWRREKYLDGLVSPHSYSLLSVREVGGLRMVCLRNPWGKGEGKEWLGGWKDGAQEWKAHPEVAEALEVDFKADGIFWLEWEDFQFLMKGFYVYPKEMPTKRGSFESEAANKPLPKPATRSDVPEAPRKKAEDVPKRETEKVEKPVRPSPKADDEPTWNEKHQCNQTWC
ncbi:unnamed protein product [Durusdinium trenchii]|uniref:Calpain catalytic domain-containing protein n=1 Tax=Durusdinium trenchii TaxID=1381693 RepID=A0ABP0N0X0_9DINO